MALDVLVGQLSKRRRATRLDLFGREIFAALRIAKGVARLLARIGEADARKRTDRESTQPAVDAIAHDKRAMAAGRQAHAKPGQRAVPEVMAMYRGRDQAPQRAIGERLGLATYSSDSLIPGFGVTPGSHQYER